MAKQQLPEGWQIVKFGDIAKHISKRVEPSETDLEIYVGLEHLDPNSLKIKRHGVPSDVEGQKLLVKKGQIIFGKRRAYQRKVAVADWDCICSAHAMVLEANPKNVIPKFLPFFMQSDVFMNRAIAVSEGSLSPTIKWKVLANQEFLIPPKDTQSKSIKLLESLLKQEKDNASMTKAQELLTRVVCDQYFYRGHHLEKNEEFMQKLNGVLPDGWRYGRFKELFTKVIDNRGKTPPNHNESSEHSVPLLEINSIIDKSMFPNLDKVSKWVSQDTYETWFRAGHPQSGDLLISTVGSVGAVALAFDSSTICIAQNLVALRFKQEHVPEYWYKYCTSKYFQHLLKAVVMLAVQPSIKVPHMLDFWIPIPPKSVQIELTDTLHALSEWSKTLAGKNTSLKALGKGLINNKN